MDNILALVQLHSSGFTHKDLKKIFVEVQNYSFILDAFLGNR